MTWRRPNIGACCQETEQIDPRQQPEREFLYVDIASVDREAKTITVANRIKGEAAPSRARKRIRTNDVLISTVRPNLNAVAMVSDEFDGQIASTGFCVLRAKPDLLDPRILFYRAQHSAFIADLCSNMRGANYPAVSDAVVKSSMIPLPPPTEQRRIVELLDQADALRKRRAEADAPVERILPALFLKMFGDPATNPKVLIKKSLGSLLKVKSGEFLPAKNMNSRGDYPVYGGNGISGYHTSYMFDHPMIVIGRVGAYCGCIHHTPAKSWITDNALYVDEKEPRLRDIYLLEALKMAKLNQYAGRAGQPLISGSRIYPIEILVPKDDEQLEFERRHTLLSRALAQMESVGDEIAKIFDACLHRAFSGELTAKWREAHMKELLQEMHQQARQLDSLKIQEVEA